MFGILVDLAEKAELEQKIREIRIERYASQSIARKVLPNERVANCLRGLKGDCVEVYKHLKTDKAFYKGLIVCGSVWTCPVCASKISEKRRKELQMAFQKHKSQGGKIAMMTLTFSHQRHDKLAEILDTFSKATTKFMTGKAYNEIRKEMGMIGRIRVMEVTWSNANGFHPHAHIALFYKNKVGLKEMKAKMYRLWKAACAKFGLKTTMEYGLDLQNGGEAENYLAKHGQGKWSLDQELTKAHIKKGKLESLTPFDFLRKYQETENERYLHLFKEYALAFKGKRQLQWSQGLKKEFVIVEKSDEELAKEKTENADILGYLDWDQWKLILNKNSRAEFLNVCETFGFDVAVKTFCTHNIIELRKGD